MQEGGHSAGRLFALLACYALAGVAWSNTLGCREEDCAEGGYLHGTLACGVGEPDDYVPIINGSGAVDRTVVEGDSCLTASSNLVSWGALCECTSQPGCDGATDCSAQGGHCVANFCPTFTLRIGFTEAGRIELVEPQTDFSFGCRATGGLCVAEACQDLGREVRFEAKPHPGAVIESWTGNPDCEDGVVALDGNVECEVHFRFPEIQVSVTGSGQVIVPPYSVGCREGGGPELCTGAVAIDSYQTLRAIADPGNHLTAWDGACSGTDSEFVLTMDGDKSCTATFSTVSVGSGGSGVIEIVSLADDESLGDNVVYDRYALSCSADFSVISFASVASNLLTGASVPAEVGSSFARNRRDSTSPSDDTTQQIHPPRIGDSFADRAPTSLSADGRYAAYQYTTASNPRVYRRDLSSGAVELISTSDPADSGLGLDDRGIWPQISGNGRFVAYRGQIPAYPAEPGRAGFVDGVIVRDSCDGALPAAGCEPHSVGVSYGSAPDSWYIPVSGGGVDISHDGRYVLFAARLSGVSGGGAAALYRHDRDEDGDGTYDEDDGTATLAVVEISDAGERPYFLDASGRYVAYQSADPTLPGNASPPFYGHAFLRDICTGVPAGCTPDVLLSVQQDGQPVGDTPYGTELADLSSSGRYVAFASDNQLLFATEEIEEYMGLGQFAVVRDTCVGAPADCPEANRLVSLRTDGVPVVAFDSAVRVSDDGSLAVFIGQRDALISQPAGFFAEVLLAVTGFAPEPGGMPVILSRSPGSVSAGSSGFLLRVTGEGFVPGAVVTWSTRPPGLAVWITRALATTFISPQSLEARVSGADVDEAGLVLVRVANPGGATSSPVSITVSGS